MTEGGRGELTTYDWGFNLISDQSGGALVVRNEWTRFYQGYLLGVEGQRAEMRV